MKKQRIAALDLVRTAAILFVVILHSTTLSGVLSGEILSLKWSIGLYARHLAFCSVPLFIILSGYLQKGKKLSLSYYKGVVPLLISYTVISLLSLVVKTYYDKSLVLTPSYIIRSILDFTANDYAWYFEMYIGLFLLIPFLNLLYNACLSRRAKLTLIFTLGFLTLLPQTLMSFSPAYGTGNVYLNILPEFFSGLYPLTYYFVGCYFAEYKPFRHNRLPKFIAALASPLIPTLLCTAFSNARGAYAWYMMNGFNTLTIALTAVCVFALLYDFEPKPKPVRACVKVISESTFEIYLISFIFDLIYYNSFTYPAPLKVVLVFVSSFASAFVLRLVVLKPLSSLCIKLYTRLCDKISAADKICTNDEVIIDQKIVISQIDTELKK